MIFGIAWVAGSNNFGIIPYVFPAGLFPVLIITLITQGIFGTLRDHRAVRVLFIAAMEGALTDPGNKQARKFLVGFHGYPPISHDEWWQEFALPDSGQAWMGASERQEPAPWSCPCKEPHPQSQ